MSRFNIYNLITYEEYIKSNKDISQIYLSRLQCKHILYENEKNTIFLDLAEKVGYKWTLFGSHRELPEEKRVEFELDRINSMAASDINRAVRIVRVSNGKIFVDNTHWALSFMKRLGVKAKLRDIPFYLVDFCHEVPLIVDVSNSVLRTNKDMKNAVNAAGDIEERIQNGWRPNNISYTIGQFQDEINAYLSKSLDF